MVSPRPLRESLETSAAWHPSKTAVDVVDTGESATYEELDTLANRLANGLHEQGLRQGDRVVLLLFNCLAFPVTLYACHKRGLVPVPVDPKSSEREIAYVTDNLNSRGIVFDSTLEDRLDDVETPSETTVSVGGGPRRSVGYDQLVESGSPDRPPTFQRSQNELSYLIFTSGTTGRPDGIIQSVQSGRERIQKFVTSTGLGRNSVFFPFLPQHAGSSMVALRATVNLGGTYVMLRDFSVPAAIEVIEDYEVSHVFSVPTLTKRFLGIDGVEGRDLSSIRHWRHTGEVLTRNDCVSFMEQLTDEIYNAYGTTETGGVAMLEPADLPRHAGTAGKPTMGNEIRIVENTGELPVDVDATVPMGEPGRIVVRGSGLFEGYFDDNDEYRLTTDGDWFVTNDLGLITDEHYLEVIGRADDQILSGGDLISAVEVEDTLEEHDHVETAVVVGVPDEEWGEHVKAFVVTDVDLSADDLDEFCRDRPTLANWKRPREYEFVDHIERTETGKKRRAFYR